MGRIIVIEDNPVFAGYVCGLLESKGFQSVSTSTCNGARKLFSKTTSCLPTCACPTVTASPCWKNCGDRA